MHIYITSYTSFKSLIVTQNIVGGSGWLHKSTVCVHNVLAGWIMACYIFVDIRGCLVCPYIRTYNTGAYVITHQAVCS